MSREPATPPRIAIESLRGTLTMARVLVETGREIELAGLERETAALCTAVAGLPRPEAQALRPLLVALLQEVTALAAVLPAPRR